MPSTPDAIGLIVSDLARSVAFYRRLGAPFPAGAEHSEHGHAEALLGGGFRLLLDSEDAVRSFDPSWSAPTGGTRSSLAFRCATSDEVGQLYQAALAAGGRSHLAPWDAPWGQRYAQLRDPDGNGVDLYADLPASPAATPSRRAEELATRFDAAQSALVSLVESLTDEQWRKTGSNFPARLNDEDEGRSVGVIAYHVAINGPLIMDRIQALVAGHSPPPMDFRALNAEEAREHAGVSADEVVALLRATRPQISAAIRAIPDQGLDLTADTPAGPLSVAQRLERVLIGHLEMHRGSIEAALTTEG